MDIHAADSGVARRSVDNWLATKALQHQEKHLSVTKVLLDEEEAIVGYYTLATGQVDFSDLPAELARRLPRRLVARRGAGVAGSELRAPRPGIGRFAVGPGLARLLGGRQDVRVCRRGPRLRQRRRQRHSTGDGASTSCPAIRIACS